MQYQSNQGRSAKDEKKRQTLEEKRMEQVSFELGVPKDIVEKSVEVLMSFMKSKIEEPDIKSKGILSEEEFKKQVPIIKVPHLGFLVPNYKVYSKLKKRQNK